MRLVIIAVTVALLVLCGTAFTREGPPCLGSNFTASAFVKDDNFMKGNYMVNMYIGTNN